MYETQKNIKYIYIDRQIHQLLNEIITVITIKGLPNFKNKKKYVVSTAFLVQLSGKDKFIEY